MAYGDRYLEERRRGVDVTEWHDILSVLRAMRVPRSARIVELGSGEGLLLRFLVKHGYRNVRGYDLLYEDELVTKADLTKTEPEPPFDVCISQHFLEHIPQDRAVELLKHCLRHGWLSVNIVPGHYVDDPTHVVNHYEYEDLVELAKRVEPPYYAIWPDSRSFFSPEVRDWVLVLSKRRIPKHYHPLLVRLGRRIIGLYLGLVARRYRRLL